MKRYINKFLFVFFFPLLFSCNNYQKDTFYEKKIGWDYLRIPILKPYAALKTANIWGIKLYPDNILFQPSIGVSKINVIDSIIVIYCDRTWAINGRNVDSSWCYIIPSKKIEACFTDKKSFLKSVSKYTAKEIYYHDINDIWEQFDKTSWLDWFPNKIKGK
jgi:hypothetical protein